MLKVVESGLMLQKFRIIIQYLFNKSLLRFNQKIFVYIYNG